MGRVPGEFLWLQFEKLSVVPLRSAKKKFKKMDVMIRNVIKSKAVSVDKPLECKVRSKVKSYSINGCLFPRFPQLLL